MQSRSNIKRYIFRSDRILKAYEKMYKKEIHEALKEQAKYAIEHNFEIKDTLTPVIEQLYNEVGLRMYEYQYQLLDDTTEKSMFLNTFDVWLKSYLATIIGKRVRNINDTTRLSLKKIIEEGFVGRTLFELTAEKLQQIYAFSAKRAMMIVRTEIGNINNEAKDRSSEDWKRESGNELYKIWIHRGAKDPRDWHVSLDNGKAIPKEQAFIVSNPNGETDNMSRPHDQTASAGNTINCGCEVIYISESYAKRNGLI